jgi:hypothetical protein
MEKENLKIERENIGRGNIGKKTPGESILALENYAISEGGGGGLEFSDQNVHRRPFLHVATNCRGRRPTR